MSRSTKHISVCAREHLQVWFARSRPAGESSPPPAARVDRQAFRLLYERYVQQIYGFCYLRLGSHELAEDATSEVFVKAMTGLDGYRGGVFAGWLSRIAQDGRIAPTGPVIVVTDWAQ